VDTVEILLINV